MPVEFRADLHIHTCLSPCADLSMTPRAVVERAASLGIDMIAVCDHNSGGNVGAAKDHADRKGITLIPGIEINSAEEVHILCLFGEVMDAIKMQSVVYENLEPGENDEEKFGMQVVVNADDEVTGFNGRLLLGATRLSVDRIVETAHRLGGIAVASHIDREGFGIIGQLGFIPADIPFDALEISRRTDIADAEISFQDCRHIPWVTCSDAHRLEDIGKRTTGFVMERPTFGELRLALRGTAGRRVLL